MTAETSPTAKPAAAVSPQVRSMQILCVVRVVLSDVSPSYRSQAHCILSDAYAVTVNAIRKL